MSKIVKKHRGSTAAVIITLGFMTFGVWHNRKGPSESSLFMLLCSTTAVVIIMLGFMTFGVGHKQDSGKAWR